MTSYRDAGVDLEGADRHVAAIGPIVKETWTDQVVGGFGGFAAGVQIPAGYKEPVLMMSTDGVGTKLELARASGSWGGVGHDLVAMCVDDLAAVGAKPIGFVDYMAVGSLQPDRDQTIVASIAEACRLAGCPLLGGETAEHPGVMAADAVDLAGAAMGVVERGSELGPHRVAPGDQVIGLRSPNLRSNGFSLARAVFADSPARSDLLDPSVIYSPAVLAVASSVNSAAHITGGGITGNLSRALPDGLAASIDRETWQPPDVFAEIASRGVSEEEMWSTFNMGIGFCLVVSPECSDDVMKLTQEHDPARIGQILPGAGVIYT